jgi:hypothetical protein
MRCSKGGKKGNFISKMTITWSGRRIECELKAPPTSIPVDNISELSPRSEWKRYQKNGRWRPFLLMKKCKKTQKNTKRVRLVTQATQAARDHHPPKLSKQRNTAIDNQPMGISTYLRCGKVSLMKTVKKKWRKRYRNAKTEGKMMAMGGDSRQSRDLLARFDCFNPVTDLEFFTKKTFLTVSFTKTPVFIVCATLVKSRRPPWLRRSQ